MIVNELVTKFSYQGSASPLQKFNFSLGGSVKMLGAVTVATLAATAAVTKFAQSTLKNLDPMIQLARRTGVAIERIQTLGYVASVTGSDANALQSSIEGLSEKIGEAAQQGSEDFSRLGISVRDATGHVKRADRVLAEVGSRFRSLGLSKSEQASFAQKLGIDKSLIQMLRLSSDEMMRLKNRALALGVITEKDAKATMAFNDSLTTLKFGITALRNKFAIALAPAMKETAERFTDFLINNKALIKDGLDKTIVVVTGLLDVIGTLGKDVMTFVEAIGGWKVALFGLGVAFAVAFWPLTLSLAAIAAAALAFDDLMTHLRGGKSVIGEFVEEFKAQVLGLVEWMHPLIEAMDKIMKFMGVTGQSAIEISGASGPSAPANGAQAYYQAMLDQGNSLAGVTNTVTQNVSIDIRADDPIAAGNAVKDTLTSQLGDANTQLSSGGR